MKKIFSPQLTALATGTSALCLMGSVASADIVHIDDVIITGGSLCVGFDCVNGESFGFDTLRLKENNLRLHFQDTSSSASFPTNDWRIIINSSSNGGGNYFGIQDADAARIPFRVEAGAPLNALYVENDGDIGFGTSNPVVNLHVVDGNTPTLRLEQDGSNGFAPQTWDVAGNEANFFLRDATNGSTLPFRVRPGAPSSSIDIAAGGDVGIGASSPSAPLHIRRTDGTAKVLVEDTSASQGKRVMLQLANKGDPAIQMLNTAFNTIEWEMRAGQRFIIDDGLDSAISSFPFDLSANGDLTLAGSLTTGGSGACSVTACDAVFDPEVYSVPSIEDHATKMWDAQYLPAVGPTLVGEPINMTSKMLAMLNELEHAHIYIEQLNTRIATLEITLGNQ